jgi:hypothetical protein
LQKDYEDFVEFLESGSEEGEYKLSLTDKLKKNNTMGRILRNFCEIIVDAAGHPEDIDYCYKYIKILFENYTSAILKNPDEKKEVVNIIMETLTLLNDIIPDNIYLTDICGAIVHVLVHNEIMIWKDFEQLRDLTEEQIQCICEVVCKAILYFEDASHDNLIEEVQKYSVFKANKNLFNFTWKGVSSIK